MFMKLNAYSVSDGPAIYTVCLDKSATDELLTIVLSNVDQVPWHISATSLRTLDQKPQFLHN